MSGVKWVLDKHMLNKRIIKLMDTGVFSSSRSKFQLFGLSYKTLPGQILLTFSHLVLHIFSTPCTAAPLRDPWLPATQHHTHWSSAGSTPSPLSSTEVPRKTQPFPPQCCPWRIPAVFISSSDLLLYKSCYHSLSYACFSHRQCNPENWVLRFSPFIQFHEA